MSSTSPAIHVDVFGVRRFVCVLTEQKTQPAFEEYVDCSL